MKIMYRVKLTAIIVLALFANASGVIDYAKWKLIEVSDDEPVEQPVDAPENVDAATQWKESADVWLITVRASNATMNDKSNTETLRWQATIRSFAADLAERAFAEKQIFEDVAKGVAHSAQAKSWAIAAQKEWLRVSEAMNAVALETGTVEVATRMVAGAARCTQRGSNRMTGEATWIAAAEAWEHAAAEFDGGIAHDLEDEAELLQKMRVRLEYLTKIEKQRAVDKEASKLSYIPTVLPEDGVWGDAPQTHETSNFVDITHLAQTFLNFISVPAAMVIGLSVGGGVTSAMLLLHHSTATKDPG